MSSVVLLSLLLVSSELHRSGELGNEVSSAEHDSCELGCTSSS